MTTPITPAPMTAEPDRSVGQIEDCTKEQLIEMVQRAGLRAGEREEHIAWLEAERIGLQAELIAARKPPEDDNGLVTIIADLRLIADAHSKEEHPHTTMTCTLAADELQALSAALKEAERERGDEQSRHLATENLRQELEAQLAEARRDGER